jgi:ketosteroid isomerase-like protein
MSQENVDRVRLMIDVFNRRDLDTFVSALHPDVDWVPALIRLAEAGPENEFRGIEGFRRWVALTDEVMSEFRVEAEDFVDVDDARVLLLGRVVGRGRASGADVTAELGQVFTFRDGLLISYRGYLDRSEARAAVGLPN